MKWGIVVQRITEGNFPHVETIEEHEGQGWTSHDSILKELMSKYAEDGDVRIMGNDRVCYKEPDKTKHPVWYI